jgi:hypothetical protein
LFTDLGIDNSIAVGSSMLSSMPSPTAPHHKKYII